MEVKSLIYVPLEETQIPQFRYKSFRKTGLYHHVEDKARDPQQVGSSKLLHNKLRSIPTNDNPLHVKAMASVCRSKGKHSTGKGPI